MNQLCLSLLAIAAQLGGYNLPTDCPQIVPITQAELQSQVCPGRNCPVMGVYRYGEEALLIDKANDLQDHYARSVIVHELIHFLQDRNKETSDDSCKAQLTRESVAFWVQEQFLKRNGIRRSLRHNLNLYRCRKS